MDTIISTHSPLIANSVRDSWVYMLNHDHTKRICSEKIDINSKAATTSQVLQEIFGVPFSMPLWVEEKFHKIINVNLDNGINEDSIEKIRSDFAQMGLEHLMPTALLEVINKIGNCND